MKRSIRWILIATVLVACWLAIRSIDWESTQAKIDRMNQLLDTLSRQDRMNGTVLVASKGKILIERGFGVRDADANLAHDPSSIFRIYSVTKAFTSVLIFQLIDEGKMSLTDPLSKFYPDLPNADTITIEHLLTHTSGLFDYTQQDGFENNHENLIELLKAKPLDFPPGTRWSYCNSGYCLLGHIIEKVTQRSIEANLQLRIFALAGMEQSGFRYETLIAPSKSVGYRVLRGSQQLPASELPSSGPFAAGAIYSTTGDLFRFHQALQSGKLLSESSLKRATSPSQQSPGYGYGWQIGYRFFGRKIVSHSGGADGFRSNFVREPARDTCVVVLCNHESANTDFIASKLQDILDGRRVTIPKGIDLSVEQLAPFVGMYQSRGDEPSFMRISVVGQSLIASFNGQPTVDLIPLTPTKFLHLEADSEFEFERADDDVGLTVRNSNSKLTFQKAKGSWGILGNATTVGWDSKQDIVMVNEDPSIDRWSIKEVKLREGELKFRFDNNWLQNYGRGKSDHDLILSGPNIHVKTGRYRISIDLRDIERPTFEIEAIAE